MNIFRAFMAIIGGLLTVRGAMLMAEYGIWLAANDIVVLLIMALLGVIIGAVLAKPLLGFGREVNSKLISVLHRTSTYDIAAGSIGLISGLIIGILATLPLPRDIPVVGKILPTAITLILGYIGAMVAVRKRNDLMHMADQNSRLQDRTRSGRARPNGQAAPKILDTSAIIDGRIADVAKTGFLEGTLVVPRFVLSELQHIADSADVLKRNRGRRGLDILNRMQKEACLPIQISERDAPGIADVDGKLVELAKMMSGRVVTNDFNLNKVAELQGIQVLNINDLVNAIKPVVLPGEEMRVRVVKDGKEQGQGVGYLDDGTMIVVDGGRRFIGESIGVQVTNVLQTAAGRMIFAKPKMMERAL